MKLSEITRDWERWLIDAGWYDDLPKDLDVKVYGWNDDIDGDVFDEDPHLAIKDASGPIPRVLAWPVHVDGWADAPAIGWVGIERLIQDGRRQ